MVVQLDMLQYKVSVVQDQRLLSRLAQSNTSKLHGSGGGGGGQIFKLSRKCTIKIKI